MLKPKLEPNVLWTIERLVPGGRGLARLTDGRIGFAEQVAPGDTIRVVHRKEHKQFVEALRWEMVEPGAARSHPECAHFGRCGGCDWMHLNRAGELDAKRDLLTDALTRIGKLSELPSIRLVASAPILTLGYRNRQRFHVSLAGKIGLFAHKSHDLVEIETCAVSHPEVVRGLLMLRAAFRSSPQAGRWVSEAEVRFAPGAPKLAVRLVPRDQGFDNPAFRNWISALEASFDLVTFESYRETEPQRWQLTDELFLVAPPSAFVQVNPEINRQLVAFVLERAQALGLRSFADLYAGAGNFSIPLCAQGLTGVALEQSTTAVTAGLSQLRELGLDTRLRYLEGDVRKSIKKLASPTPFELAILDPPREGAKEIIPTLLKLRPEHILYCACDPVALARDLRPLLDSGYRLTSLTLFDMFPRTHHFESVAWLERAPRPPPLPEPS